MFIRRSSYGDAVKTCYHGVHFGRFRTPLGKGTCVYVADLTSGATSHFSIAGGTLAARRFPDSEWTTALNLYTMEGTRDAAPP
jgi:hypothetical protein